MSETSKHLDRLADYLAWRCVYLLEGEGVYIEAPEKLADAFSDVIRLRVKL